MRFPTTPGVNLCALHRPSVSQRVLLTAAASRGSEGAARDERARNDRRAHSSHVSFLHTHTPHTKPRPLHTRPPCARGRRARAAAERAAAAAAAAARSAAPSEERRGETSERLQRHTRHPTCAPHRTAPHRTAPHRTAWSAPARSYGDRWFLLIGSCPPRAPPADDCLRLFNPVSDSLLEPLCDLFSAVNATCVGARSDARAEDSQRLAEASASHWKGALLVLSSLFVLLELALLVLLYVFRRRHPIQQAGIGYIATITVACLHAHAATIIDAVPQSGGLCRSRLVLLYLFLWLLLVARVSKLLSFCKMAQVFSFYFLVVLQDGTDFLFLVVLQDGTGQDTHHDSTREFTPCHHSLPHPPPPPPPPLPHPPCHTPPATPPLPPPPCHTPPATPPLPPSVSPPHQRVLLCRNPQQNDFVQSKVSHPVFPPYGTCSTPHLPYIHFPPFLPIFPILHAPCSTPHFPYTRFPAISFVLALPFGDGHGMGRPSAAHGRHPHPLRAAPPLRLPRARRAEAVER